MHVSGEISSKSYTRVFVSFPNIPYSTFFSQAGNESCPQPQTSEHLAAIEIMKLKHILILQNKIDLVKESQAREQYEQILKFVEGKILLSFLFVCQNVLVTKCTVNKLCMSAVYCVSTKLSKMFSKHNISCFLILKVRWPRAPPSFRSQRS